MTAPVEPELDTAVHQPLAQQPVPDADLHEQVHRPLLEHAGPNAALDVLPAPGLEDHRVDAEPVQQVGEDEAGRPGADDPDLRSLRNHARGDLLAAPVRAGSS